MNTERKIPALCLKANVHRALHNGKRVDLKNAPIYKDGEMLIPKEALALVGIRSENEYRSANDVAGISKVYEDMGLIFFDTDKDYPALDTGNDIGFILSVAHSFIFEITVGTLGKDYAPATDRERADFKRVGTQIRDMLLKRNNTHPFIYATDDIFDALCKIYSSECETEEKGFIQTIINRADKFITEIPALNEAGDGLVSDYPPPDYGGSDYDVGGRHSNSEAHLTRLAELAFAYRITGDEKYARLAYFGALSVSRRNHWGPGHFLNCSGATMQLARIYDWLYHPWRKMGLDTRPIKRGIYNQGLHHGYNSVILDTCDFPSPKQGTGWRFKLKPDNWNSVCNCGMIVGALTILAEGVDDVICAEEYEKVTELLGASITSTMQPNLVFTQYAPDGSYVESNSYWAYGTSNLVCSMAALHSALGTDLGLHHACGFDRTCYYAINTESAEYVGWNYHDGGLGQQETQSFNPLGVISGDTKLFALRQSHLARGKSVNVLDLLYHPTVRGVEVPELSALPLDYAMNGIDAFTVRSGWDKGSLFAGIMGGENPKGGSHSQLDSGAFVYHNLGRMWICDLGSDNYNSRGIANGEGYFSNYALYRRNAEGNNSLCLNSLPFGQLLDGRGVMTDCKSSDSASYAVIDNVSVYGEDKVKYARRGMLLTNNRSTLVIKDEVEFNGSESAFTTAHFESKKITAELSHDAKKCTLTHEGGEKIYVSVLGDGRLEIMDCSGILEGTAPATGEHSREDYSRLVIRHEGRKTVNTSFVIDIKENSDYNKNMSIEEWKTL